MKTQYIAGLGVILGLFSCGKGSIALIGKNCPCVKGYVCEEATNTCIKASDAGFDSGPLSPDASLPNDAATDTPIVDPAPQCLDHAGLGSAVLPIDETNCDEPPWSNQLVYCTAGGDISGFTNGCNQMNTTAQPSSSSFVSDPKYRGSTSEQFSVASDSEILHRIVFSMSGPTCDLLPSGADDLYYRAYLHLPDTWSMGMTFISLNKFAIGIDENARPTYRWTEGETVQEGAFEQSIAKDSWTCLEVHASHTDGLVEAWIDEVCIGQFPLTTTTITEGTDLKYGIIEQTQSASTYPQSITIDELMVADKRIGCD